LAQSKTAVEDYLKRRGGEGLPSGSNGWVVTLAVIALIIASVFFAIR
jgi:hypothetical protein